MSEVYQVSDLRPRLRDAALGVGFKESDTITRHGAIRAWAQWELGDPQWAEDFVTLYKFPEQTRNRTD